MICGTSKYWFVCPLSSLLGPFEKITDVFVKVALILLVRGTPSLQSYPKSNQNGWYWPSRNRLQPSGSSSTSILYGTIAYGAGLGLIRMFFVFAIIGEFLVVLVFFWKRFNFACGGRTISVSFHLSRAFFLNSLVATKAFFIPNVSSASPLYTPWNDIPIISILY